MENDVIKRTWPEWSVVKQLGKGAYGVVYEAVRNDYSVESKSAIKVITIPSDEGELDSLRAEGFTEDDTRTYLSGIVNDFVGEIQLMESFKGVQNIVSVEDYKVIENTEKLGFTILIRMELLTPFNSFLENENLPEKAVINLGIDICRALEICARRKVIHRDIKPENIFINEYGDYKLGDFGVARKLENIAGSLSQKGTFNYMAPEVEKGTSYNETVDLYSLGLVLYRFLNGKLMPFLTPQTNLNPNERMAAVRRRLDGEPLPPPRYASEEMAAIILKATAYDPNMRYRNASEMKRALENLANGVKTEKTAAVKPDVNAVAPDRAAKVRQTNAGYGDVQSVKPNTNRNNAGVNMARPVNGQVNTSGPNANRNNAGVNTARPVNGQVNTSGSNTNRNIAGVNTARPVNEQVNTSRPNTNRNNAGVNTARPVNEQVNTSGPNTNRNNINVRTLQQGSGRPDPYAGQSTVVRKAPQTKKEKKGKEESVPAKVIKIIFIALAAFFGFVIVMTILLLVMEEFGI
ncbi:MAG: protein kinase [Lachnospiraceae bacterium]|nr:protein kinase [Lachnospiraceae bacterium]